MLRAFVFITVLTTLSGAFAQDEVKLAGREYLNSQVGLLVNEARRYGDSLGGELLTGRIEEAEKQIRIEWLEPAAVRKYCLYAALHGHPESGERVGKLAETNRYVQLEMSKRGIPIEEIYKPGLIQGEALFLVQQGKMAQAKAKLRELAQLGVRSPEIKSHTRRLERYRTQLARAGKAAVPINRAVKTVDPGARPIHRRRVELLNMIQSGNKEKSLELAATTYRAGEDVACAEDFVSRGWHRDLIEIARRNIVPHDDERINDLLGEITRQLIVQCDAEEIIAMVRMRIERDSRKAKLLMDAAVQISLVP